MSSPSPLLAEPLSLGQDTISRRSSSRILLLSSLIIGFVFAVLFSPVKWQRGEVEDPAVDMVSLSCPRFNMPMSLTDLESKVAQHGIPITPLAKYALAQYASTRDVSMKAQAKEAFANLDPVTQAKVKQLGKDVIVRAASLKPDEMAGATKPLGFWDPAGLSKNSKFGFLRAAELKHGRVCMLASLGFVVSEKFHPIYDAWGDGPFTSAVSAHLSPTALKNFWPAFLINCLLHEYFLEFSRSKTEPMGGADLDFDPLNIKPTNPEALRAMEDKELNNARLAILAASGMIAQELATGKAIFA